MCHVFFDGLIEVSIAQCFKSVSFLWIRLFAEENMQQRTAKSKEITILLLVTILSLNELSSSPNLHILLSSSPYSVAQ